MADEEKNKKDDNVEEAEAKESEEVTSDELDIEEAVLEDVEVADVEDGGSSKKDDEPEEKVDDAEEVKEEAEEKDILEKVVEEEAQAAKESEPKDEKVEPKKKETKLKHKKVKRSGSGSSSRVRVVAAIVLTMLVTAAAVLGVMYYLDQRNNEPAPQEEEVVESVEEEKEEVVDSEEGSEDVVYISSAVGLNLREEPNTSSEVLIIIPFGTEVPVLAEEDGWIQTEYDGKNGWVSEDYTSAENPWVYENEDYGFSLTFDGGWEGYEVYHETVDGVKVFYIGLPTTESGWVSTGVDAGYSSMFALSVYPKAKWSEVESSAGPKPVKLDENSTYVFAWSSAQSRPDDLETQFDEIGDIVDTFELI